MVGCDVVCGVLWWFVVFCGGLWCLVPPVQGLYQEHFIVKIICPSLFLEEQFIDHSEWMNKLNKAYKIFERCPSGFYLFRNNSLQ